MFTLTPQRCKTLCLVCSEGVRSGVDQATTPTHPPTQTHPHSYTDTTNRRKNMELLATLFPFLEQSNSVEPKAGLRDQKHQSKTAELTITELIIQKLLCSCVEKKIDTGSIPHSTRWGRTFIFMPCLCGFLDNVLCWLLFDWRLYIRWTFFYSHWSHWQRA